MNKFQERLSELLMDRRLSRLQLAKLINVSSTTINGYFNNNYYPQLLIAIKMSKYFNCSLDYLFGIVDEIGGYNSNIKEDNILDKFNKNLDDLINLNKLSIAKTMEALEMSEYNYYRWKNGKFPKTINLIAIALYFDVTIDDLLI